MPGFLLKPRSFRQGILALPRFFAADRSVGIDAILQFEVTGREHGLWHVVIRDQRLSVKEGPAEEPPTLTIRTPSEVWLRIMRSELNGAEAFLTGQATAVGDTRLLMKLKTLFRFRIERSTRDGTTPAASTGSRGRE